MPLAIALTPHVRAEGPAVVLTDAVRYRGEMVSLDAKNVTPSELAQQLNEAIGCEVRIEGQASGTVSLNVRDVPAATLMAKAASVLGGRWQVLYRLSTKDPAPAPAVPSGVVVTVKMPKVSCQAAAAVVARMAGGRLDRDGELTGQVSLVGDALPVEEAMDTIARASNTTWRRIYVMKVDELPQAPAPSTAETKPSKPETKPAPPEKKPGRFGDHWTVNGKPTKFVKRDRRPGTSVYGKYGEGVKPIQPTMEEIQKYAMMGLYGTFFLLDTEARREAAMKRFQTGLELQIKRLETLPASQRTITTMMARRNFQRLVDDYVHLTDEQKKEAEKLYEYAKEQLAKPPLKQ
jgi:hypothetical protein